MAVGDQGYFIRWTEPHSPNVNHGEGETLRYPASGGLMGYKDAFRLAFRYKTEYNNNKRVWLVDIATMDEHEVM